MPALGIDLYPVRCHHKPTPCSTNLPHEKTTTLTHNRPRICRACRKCIHLRHTQDWKDPLAWEAFTQWQRNEFTNLTNRALIGGGLRWDLISTDRKAEGARLYLGTGAFYEHQSIRNEPDRETIRANIYLSAVLPVFADSSLSGTLYYQPACDDPSDYRATCALGFSVPMSENLSLELSFNLTHDSRPPATVEKTDIEYLTGIRWSF